MDSISQAVWGALSAEGVKRKKKTKVPAWLIGLAAGTAPDLDSFFSSSTDPLFATVMHRNFTHSIFFVPIGAALIWLCFYYFFRHEKENHRHYYLICLFGYGTHWILDVLTAYGTQIFWPFTNYRFATDWLSIVDPLLTIPWIISLVVIVYTGSETKQKLWKRSIFFYTTIYMLFCGYQHYRATQASEALAKTRGHKIEKLRLLPSLGNSFWFRSIYLSDGQIFADGVLVRPWSSVILYRFGDSRPHLSVNDFQTQNDRAIKQIRIWDWFTGGWMYLHQPTQSGLTAQQLGDGRYSTQVSGFHSLWIFKLDLENPQHSIKTQPQLDNLTAGRSPFEGFQLLFNTSTLNPL